VPEGRRTTWSATGVTEAPARILQRVTMPAAGAVTSRPGIVTAETVQPPVGSHGSAVSAAAVNALPIVTSARAAGPAASTISVHTTTTDALIGASLTQPTGTG
jgi:hypothetical protein